MLATARLGCLRENGPKRNVALTCSCDHDGGGEESFQKFSKQGHAYLNSPRRDAVTDHAQKMIIGSQVQNSVDQRFTIQSGCDPTVRVIRLRCPFVFEPEAHFSAFG